MPERALQGQRARRRGPVFGGQHGPRRQEVAGTLGEHRKAGALDVLRAGLHARAVPAAGDKAHRAVPAAEGVQVAGSFQGQFLLPVRARFDPGARRELCARSVGPPLTVQAVRVRQRRRLSGLARIDAGRQQQAYPLAMVARHRFRVLAAASHEAGDATASSRCTEAAVAGVQAPSHGRGRIRQRAVRDPLHGHEGVARLHLAGDALAVRQVLVVDAAVSDYTRDAGLQPVRNALPVGTGDHFQAAVFAPGGGQRDPQVEDHGVADLLGQVLVVLVPRHVGGVVLGELHPQHRLRMGQDLRPDH